MERRLAAIMSVDVVGYSRLIRADEEGTIAALKALRADLVDPKLNEHNGRIVKLMGDGTLAEFPSVVDAVRAAVEIQQSVAEQNSELSKDKRIEFRVGINLGDVVIDGDDIQGDGINVAARLEGIAEPGGICISGSVHEQVRDRTDYTFEDLGEQEVKNIDRPVRVWQWTLATTANSKVEITPSSSTAQPSIAVLPFDNMSSDPEHEFFADGIAEDIITALSKISRMRVIARNSTFT
jgi:adenylate cyclase